MGSIDLRELGVRHFENISQWESCKMRKLAAKITGSLLNIFKSCWALNDPWKKLKPCKLYFFKKNYFIARKKDD